MFEDRFGIKRKFALSTNGLELTAYSNGDKILSAAKKNGAWEILSTSAPKNMSIACISSHSIAIADATKFMMNSEKEKIEKIECNIISFLIGNLNKDLAMAICDQLQQERIGISEIFNLVREKTLTSSIEFLLKMEKDMTIHAPKLVELRREILEKSKSVLEVDIFEDNEPADKSDFPEVFFLEKLRVKENGDTVVLFVSENGRKKGLKVEDIDTFFIKNEG